MRHERMLQDFDKDIREHSEAERLANSERGMSPDKVCDTGLRKFDNVTRVK